MHATLTCMPHMPCAQCGNHQQPRLTRMAGRTYWEPLVSPTNGWQPEGHERKAALRKLQLLTWSMQRPKARPTMASIFIFNKQPP